MITLPIGTYFFTAAYVFNGTRHALLRQCTHAADAVYRKRDLCWRSCCAHG